MNRKAVVAMSGGVDSSVTAWLMKEKGYDCVGATMKLFFSEGQNDEGSCCTQKDIEDAQNVATTLGMPYYVFDFSERFEDAVIKHFIRAYETGSTPNPCIDCNRYLKFNELYRHAKELGCDIIATGHYARIEKDDKTGRYILKKAVDPTKDQSYVLYSLTQEQLSRTIFPLGEMTKVEVRALAEKHGFINADKQDSQDICFVKNESYADFIERHVGKKYPAGDFIDKNGKVLGRHRGVIRYTIGQRKGLGIAYTEPLYVCAVDPCKNIVTLGSEKDLFSKKLVAHDINLISVPEITEPMRIKAKVRYRQTEQWATAIQTDGDTLLVEFDEPQRAITSGQAVVLYDGDIVVGGGTIE